MLKSLELWLIWYSLCIVPLPQSNNSLISPASTRVDDPNLSNEGTGLPVPRSVTLKSEDMSMVRDMFG